MRNLKVRMSYVGTAYHGYQRQNNACTVQQTVEEALEKLLGERISVNGCSRTDAGVHAREYVFSFMTENRISLDGLVKGANDLLPADIAFLSAEEEKEDFHARYSCKGKEYEYVVCDSGVKNPFCGDRVMRYRYKTRLDEKLLDREAKAFVGKHDFKAFCSADCEKDDTSRTVFAFDVTRDGDFLKFKVSGDGFLYNMVRIMVGTLICVNEGKIKPDTIKEIILSKDRTKAGITVSPEGLYLNRVFY